MSGIDKITQRIIADANETAAKNKEAAAIKASAILSESEANAEKQRQAIIDGAKADAVDIGMRKRAVSDLEMRKQLLKAKRGVMDGVFANAKQALAAIDDTRYTAMMAALLTTCASDAGSGTIKLGRRDGGGKPAFVAEAEKQLAAAAKSISLAIDNEQGDFAAGFIFYAGGLEMNCSTDSVIEQSRDRLETDVYRILFEQ